MIGLTKSQDEIKQEIANRTISVKGLPDLVSRLSRLKDSSWLFRGVTDEKHYPIPSIGRKQAFPQYKVKTEKRVFEEFKAKSFSMLRDPRLDEWDLLAIAQHLGIPTRLLDWSLSPLVAAFFALEKDCKSDRYIYCLKLSKFTNESDRQNLSPFDISTVQRFTPRYVFPRISAQKGVFTVHPYPTLIYFHDTFKILKIPNSLTGSMRKKLFKFGFDYQSIYPDESGLAMQISWQCRNKIGFGSITADT